MQKNTLGRLLFSNTTFFHLVREWKPKNNLFENNANGTLKSVIIGDLNRWLPRLYFILCYCSLQHCLSDYYSAVRVCNNYYHNYYRQLFTICLYTCKNYTSGIATSPKGVL